MSLLLKVYNDLLLSKGFFKCRERRPLIEYALDLVEEVSRREGVLLLQLPTGYGKTAITFASFFRALVDPELFWRVIHVSPLRSIIDDIYGRMRDGYRRVLASVPAAEHFEKYVGAQMMLSPGSPYLQKRLTITTFDTLSLSLAKIPVEETGEISRGVGHGHFDIPRASILEALVVMDEVHAFLSEAGKSRASEVLTSMIYYLIESRTPLVLMSATMPKALFRKLLGELSGILRPFHYREVYYGDEGVIDRDWENEQINKSVETRILRGGIRDLVKESINLASSYDRTLVVLNTIPRALQVYRELKRSLKCSKPLMLLHSKFRKADRESKLNVAINEGEWVLVSTQVIESGVDISADALITDAAPANNLVQRAGRVARMPSDEGGVVVIVEEDGEVERGFGIYDGEVLRATMEGLRKHADDDKIRISWRSLSHDGHVGYQKFVDEVYSKRDWHFPMDPIYYELISSFEWTSSDALRCLARIYDGSFLRESPLIPLIVSPFNELSYETLIEDSLPLDLEDVNRMLRRGIKMEKLIRRGGKIVFEELRPRDLGNLVKEVVLGGTMALRALEPEAIYTSTEGLVV